MLHTPEGVTKATFQVPFAKSQQLVSLYFQSLNKLKTNKKPPNNTESPQVQRMEGKHPASSACILGHLSEGENGENKEPPEGKGAGSVLFNIKLWQNTHKTT